MKRRHQAVNPFYVILVLAGVAFCITACAYGVLIVKGLQTTGPQQESVAGRWLLEWMDANGAWLLMWELIVLGICTFAAISTDAYWTRRFERKRTARGDSHTHSDNPEKKR